MAWVTIYSSSIGQYIDEFGKARALIYQNGLTLETPPIPPLLNKKQVKISNLQSVDSSIAILFITKNNLKITKQQLAGKEKINGLWVVASDQEHDSSFIPILETTPFENVPLSNEFDFPPLNITRYPSLLEQQLFTKKIALVLKAFALYLYSLSPKNISNSFQVVKNFDYNNALEKMGNRMSLDSPIIHNGKLIVPSRRSVNMLLQYIQIQLANDREYVMNFATLDYIPLYYSEISDFKSNDNQLIFINKRNLVQWKKSLANIDLNKYIWKKPLPSTITEPFFYLLNYKIWLVQNVQGGKLELAIAVSYIWNTTKVNTGYNGPEPDQFPPSTISKITLRPDSNIKDIKADALALDYGDGIYAALLFL